ncbi:MAG TPA: hypothetical protein VJN89_22495 [Candidatus Acidoferrum sp.]|nr:hypothetical protein [Candidatus Acidoferrum sp.]
MSNAKFIYLHRDGSNYKKPGQVVFSNPDELSCDFVTEVLRKAFLQDGLFIAYQIRVPDSFLYAHGEANTDDHCYHEFESVESSSDSPNDQYGRSMSQFLTEVQEQAASGWIAFDPHELIHFST